MKPSIGASTASWPYAGSMAGKAKKSMSSMMSCWVSSKLLVTNVPSRYMPTSLLPSAVAASCQVRPFTSGW